MTATLGSADLESHHIEGYARAAMERGADGYFSAPLVSHITGNLWSGGCRDFVRLPDDFDFVLSLYPWERYALGPTTHRAEIRMYDAGELPDYAEALRIATSFVELGKTLIHCQAGLNRSGLLSALVLRSQGMTSRAAIDLLREKRSPMVLCNQTFEDHLLELDK